MQSNKYFYIKDYSYLNTKKKIKFKGFSTLAFGFLLGVFTMLVSFNQYQKVEFFSPVVSLASDSYLTPSPTSSITPTLTPSVTPTNTPSPTPELRKYKSNYKIAILGDSMTDTAGKGLPKLSQKLNNIFPSVKFDLYNYGVGARDLAYGLYRLNHDYVYMNENIPSLLSQKPDIILIESFAYNHWSGSQSDLDKQWSTLTQIVEYIKNNSQVKIVFLNTIAPNSNVYAKGIKDINWTDEQRKEQAQLTKLYLENHKNYARSAHIPIIDVFSVSLDSSGEGILSYINPSDNLHPSDAGHELVADQIASWLLNNL